MNNAFVWNSVACVQEVLNHHTTMAATTMDVYQVNKYFDDIVVVVLVVFVFIVICWFKLVYTLKNLLISWVVESWGRTMSSIG